MGWVPPPPLDTDGWERELERRIRFTAIGTILLVCVAAVCVGIIAVFCLVGR